MAPWGGQTVLWLPHQDRRYSEGEKDLRKRTATPPGVISIGAAHVALWREMYTGIMPDALLAEQWVETRMSMWTEVFRNRKLFNCSEILLPKMSSA